MLLRITQYGEPVLRQQGIPISKFDKDLRDLAEDMVETMVNADGVGLAAQQIGQAIQLCVVDVSHLPEEELNYTLDGKRPPIDLIMPLVLVNPELTLLGKPSVWAEEGCLSFPEIRGEVPRHEAIRVKYQDLDGFAHELDTTGWFARVIQHEVDHLNGVLFIDHMDAPTLRNLDSRLKRIKRQTRDAGLNYPDSQSIT